MNIKHPRDFVKQHEFPERDNILFVNVTNVDPQTGAMLVEVAFCDDNANLKKDTVHVNPQNVSDLETVLFLWAVLHIRTYTNSTAYRMETEWLNLTTKNYGHAIHNTWNMVHNELLQSQ